MTGAGHAAIREDWLALGREAAIDPDLPIVDAHHHLFDRPGQRYLAPDYLRDLADGHRVVASVFVQARAMYRPDGPEALRPVGETAFAAAVGSRHPGLCAGIVGHADLTLGDAVGAVLDAHVAAGDGRFRGVRHITAWDADAALLNPAYPTHEGLMDDAAFRRGFAELGRRGLGFDAWLFYPQLPRLAALARAFPDTVIVVDHLGGVVRTGAHARRTADVFAGWTAGMRLLAECPNVRVKLGGLGMRLSGFGGETRARPPSSTLLADWWRPWFETAIDLFGTRRCMVASNFPVDKGSHGYGVGWNAMKRIAAGASPDERDDLFGRTAAATYRLHV